MQITDNKTLGKEMLYTLSSGVIILNEDSKILLIKSPRRGWEYPGGQVEKHESIEKAAIREVFEETGFNIKIINFCGIVQNLTKLVCCFLFTGKIINKKKFLPNNEVLEIGFFTIEDAINKVNWLNFSDRIKMCLNKDSHPFISSFSED